jgi:hypothetical protein
MTCSLSSLQSSVKQIDRILRGHYIREAVLDKHTACDAAMLAVTNYGSCSGRSGLGSAMRDGPKTSLGRNFATMRDHATRPCDLRSPRSSVGSDHATGCVAATAERAARVRGCGASPELQGRRSRAVRHALRGEPADQVARGPAWRRAVRARSQWSRPDRCGHAIPRRRPGGVCRHRAGNYARYRIGKPASRQLSRV